MPCCLSKNLINGAHLNAGSENVNYRDRIKEAAPGPWARAGYSTPRNHAENLGGVD